MSHIACPQCHAELDDDLQESTGRAECPFCGADVPALATFVPTPYDGNNPEDFSLPPLPKKSKIQVIQATPHQRVFYIPGGKARSVGMFALMWNGFMAVFTTFIIVAALADQKKDDFPIFIFGGFISLFWAVGLGFAYWWVRAKFLRLFVMLETERLVIQRILFGRKKTEETDLNEHSRAELVEAYRENKRPVYRIEIVGSNRTAQFGTALGRDEKNWLVDRINEFLHPYGTSSSKVIPAKFCIQCGASLADVKPDSADGSQVCPQCGETVAAQDDNASVEAQLMANVDTAELTQPEDVTIDQQQPDHLRFHLPMCSNAKVSWIIAAIAVTFGTIFLGAAGSNFFEGNFHVFKILFFLPFFMGGLVPISIGLLALRGRITVDLTVQRIKVRYHLGLLGKSKEIATNQITDVRLVAGKESDDRIRRRSGQSQQIDLTTCVVKSSQRTLPLTLIHEKPTARFVTQLVRRQLREMGVELSS